MEYFNKSFWYKKLAEKGYSFAEKSVGHGYLLGKNGFEKDMCKAIYWLEKSGEKGDVYSQSKLGYYYYCKQNETDFKKAFYW
jgi:TPR repeat protein